MILNLLSVLVGLNLIGLINLFYASPDLLMQLLDFLGSLINFITDLAFSRQWDEIKWGKGLIPYKALNVEQLVALAGVLL